MHTREDDELAQTFLAMDRKHETFFKQVIETGAIAGLFAGSGMAIFWMALNALTGRGFLLPMKLVAAAWWTDAVTANGVGVMIGVLLHLLVSVLFGIAFASIVRRASGATSVVTGVVYGIAVYFFMRYAVVPWADPVLSARLSPWLFFASHLLFGLLAGLAVPARRAAVGRAARRGEVPV